MHKKFSSQHYLKTVRTYNNMKENPTQGDDRVHSNMYTVVRNMYVKKLFFSRKCFVTMFREKSERTTQAHGIPS